MSWVKRMSVRLDRTRGDQVTERKPVCLKLGNLVSEVESGGRQSPSWRPWEETGFHTQGRAAFEMKTASSNTHTPERKSAIRAHG